MAQSGNDWRGGGSGSRRATGMKKPQAPSKSDKAPAEAKERTDWRKKKLGTEDKAREKALAGKDYLRRRDHTYRQKVFQHRLKVGAWTGLALLMLVVLLVLLSLRPKEVTLVRVIVTDYQAPLPPNSYALEDGLQLASVANTNEDSIQVNKVMDATSPRSDFIPGLTTVLFDVQPGGPSKNTFMIYLSAHGVVNQDNEPCLLLSGADPLDTSDWLPVADLLEMFNNKELTQLNDPDNVKLLILDSGRVDDMWEAGIFYNGFADALARTIQAAGIENLYVLHSCSPGERNWSGPEINGSAFGHYVARGLNGAADLDQDRTISLYELQAYVRMRVNQWADIHRNAEQNPQLIPPLEKNTRISLAYRRSTVNEAPAMYDESPPENSKKLDSLWITHERLLDEVKPYRYDPVGWAQVQQDMVRLETLLLAGDEYNDQFQRLALAVTNKLRVLDNQSPLNAMEPINLPVARQLHGQNDSARLLQPLQQVMYKQANKIPHNLEEGPPPQPTSSQQATLAAWQWLADPDADDLSRERMNAAIDMINSAPASTASAEPIEGHFMRMLHGRIDWVDQPGLSKSLLAAIVRQAIQTRQTAELAATPTDERTIYWIQEKVDQADQQRRLAEDRLFVGSSDNAAQAQKLLAAAGRTPDEGLYGEAIADSEQMATALATRDQVWAEMRYLTAWSLWEMRAGSKTLVEPLQSLLTRTHELGVALDDRLDVERIAALTQEVRGARAAILDDYLEQVRKLNYTSAVDENTIPQILEVLRLPLYTGTHRNELRRKLMAALTRSDSNRANEETIEKPAEILKAYKQLPAWKSTDDAYLAQLAGFSEHPALTMVDPAKLGVPDAVQWSAPRRVEPPTEAQAGSERARQAAIASLAEQGSDLRDQLNQLLERPDGDGNDVAGNLERLKRISMHKMENEFQRDTVDARRGLSTADRLTRAAGPLMPVELTNSFRQPGSPTTALRKIDRYFQCLWMADRTMNDFWGPAGDQNQYYFAVVARSLLDSADRLQPGARFRQYDNQPLEPKLSALIKAAQDSLQLNGNEIVASPGQAEARLTGNIQSKPFMPEGLTAIALTSSAGQLFPFKISSETRRRFAFAVGSQPHSEQINNNILVSGDDNIDLRRQYKVLLSSFFRGHEFSSEVSVFNGDIPKNTIVTRFEPILPPEVLVRGDVQQIPSVLFVFDCSGSMSKPASGEQGEIQRIVVARDRLNSLLGRNINGDFRLPDRHFRVGLMLYGHRIGWQENAPSEKRFNPSMIAGNIDRRSLHPSLDVENLMPITMLNEKVRNDIEDILNRTKPWGQTPLYYSIKRGLEQFALDKAPADSPRQIVVLTDGANDPGTLSNNQSVSDNDIKMMIQKPQYKSIRIDIVAFDFKVEKELAGVAQASGGQIHEVNNSGALEAAFEELLTPIKYHVQQASDNRQYRDQAQPLDVRVPIDDWELAEVRRNPAKAQYKIDIFGADQPPANTDNLELLGGESLLLEYNQDSRFNRLEHQEYDPNEFIVGDNRLTVVDPTEDDPQRKFLVKAFVPKQEHDELLFDVAVQHSKFWPFTPRPQRMWVEIRPANVSSNSGDPVVYNFFDQSLVSGQPVPVYRYTIQQWPKKYSEAEVRVWFLMEDLAPAFTMELPTVNQQPNTITNDTLRQQIPGSEFNVQVDSGGQTNPYRVTVIETVQNEQKLYETCLDISPRPDFATHNYQGKQAEHQFTFNKGVTTNPELRIWSRQSIIEEAVPINDMQDKPMRVTVPE